MADHNENKVIAHEEVLRWVTFRLEDETYGINVMQVREVLRYVEIAPVPGAAEHVLGITNLRGNVVTVIDARTRFGLPKAPITESTRIIVIELKSQLIGVLVDSVVEVVDLKTSEIEKTPQKQKDENARFIFGVSNLGEKLLILVNLDKLLATEKQNIKADEVKK